MSNEIIVTLPEKITKTAKITIEIQNYSRNRRINSRNRNFSPNCRRNYSHDFETAAIVIGNIITNVVITTEILVRDVKALTMTVIIIKGAKIHPAVNEVTIIEIIIIAITYMIIRMVGKGIHTKRATTRLTINKTAKMHKSKNKIAKMTAEVI